MLLVTIAPELMIWAFLPVLVGILTGKRRNRVSYEFTMRVTEQNRKRDYVRRVFYMQKYAKELRLTNIYRVLFRQMDESLRDIGRLSANTDSNWRFLSTREMRPWRYWSMSAAFCGHHFVF